jgi:hypothetical protein
VAVVECHGERGVGYCGHNRIEHVNLQVLETEPLSDQVDT